MGQRPVARKRRTARCAAALILLAAGHAPAQGIYQWRDAEGRLHFGDAPPDREAVDLSARYDNTLPFSLVIEGVDYDVPAALRDRLTSYVRKIFTVYRQALEIEYPQEREFRIVIFGSRERYQAYQRQVAPVLENSSGFYNSATNQITTYGMDERQLLRLITHECSHAITASHGRFVPTWLNEGLAEYFEGMEVAGLGARVPVAEHWLDTLRRRGYARQAPALEGLLDVSHTNWYTANGPENLSYATSWSVVWFLMDTGLGRKIIRDLLAMQHSPLAPASMEVLDRSWPGGLAGFTDAWRQWLARAQGSHRY